MPRALIKATGMYVPERVVTNEELSKWMNTSPDWIEERTGIRERRWVIPPAGPSDLAILAAEPALAAAGWDKKDVDLVIFATLSSDVMFPGSGCLMQNKFGLGTTPALDVRNQCSGFLYGLTVAQQFCETGMYNRVLVVGAEVHSTGIDVSSEGRTVSVIFGDGAGVACVESGDWGDRGILEARLYADGSGWDKLSLIAPTTVHSPIISHDMFNQKMFAPRMNGPAVFRNAVVRLDQVIKDTLARNHLTVADIKMLIPHQANMRINQMVAGKLGFREDQVYHNIQRYGNTTAASIPIALHEAVAEGRIREGDLVLLAGFGAGFTWGTILLRW